MMRQPLQRIRPSELAWEPLGTHGLRRKVLRFDPADEHATSLVDIPNGWKGGGIAHFHNFFEEVYMLSGSVTVGGKHYWHGGDYFYRPGRVVHGHDERSPEGAHVLIRSNGPLPLLLVHDPLEPDEYPLPGVDDPRGHIHHLTPATLPWSTDASLPSTWRFKLLSADMHSGARTCLVNIPKGWSRMEESARPAMWEATVIAGSLKGKEDFVVGDYTWGPAGTECFEAAHCVDECTLLVWEFARDRKPS